MPGWLELERTICEPWRSAAEETLGYRYRGNASCPPIMLQAKVDLVLSHPDGTLEAIDFKTGRVKRDPVQEVASRVVVNAKVGKGYPPLRTTTLYAAEQTSVSEVLTLDTCKATWDEMTQTVSAILAATDWSPAPTPLCAWCPYYANGCSLDGGAADPEWIDGAAD